MEIYVYEHMTASTPAGAHPSLEREGLAMARRVAADLAAVPCVNVRVVLHETRDTGDLIGQVVSMHRPEEFPYIVQQSEEEALWLVIAPELDGTLLQLSRDLNRFGRQSLGPGLEFVELASDKLETYRQFPEQVIKTVLNPSALTEQIEWIAKPRYGAGCSEVISATPDWMRREHQTALKSEDPDKQRIYQPFTPGMTASIAAIGRRDQELLFLPAARQFVLCKPVGEFQTWHYQGGELPLSPKLHDRAQQIASTILARTPLFRGYVGVDLILGDAEDGSLDRVVEINARLTTSYVGYSEWMHRAYPDDPSCMGRLLLGEQVDLVRPYSSGEVVRYSPGGQSCWTAPNVST